MGGAPSPPHLGSRLLQGSCHGSGFRVVDNRLKSDRFFWDSLGCSSFPEKEMNGFVQAVTICGIWVRLFYSIPPLLFPLPTHAYRYTDAGFDRAGFQDQKSSHVPAAHVSFFFVLHFLSSYHQQQPNKQTHGFSAYPTSVVLPALQRACGWKVSLCPRSLRRRRPPHSPDSACARCRGNRGRGFPSCCRPRGCFHGCGLCDAP